MSRWKERKGQGQFQPRSELPIEQQILLAAVPKWKSTWVRPTSLKPHQSPSFLIKKWVIDTSSPDGESNEATEEEMSAALRVVVENKLTASGGALSGTVTPGLLEVEGEEGEEGETRGGTPMVEGEEQVEEDVVINPAKPSEGPAPAEIEAEAEKEKEGDEEEEGVNKDAVKALEGVPVEELVPVEEVKDVVMEDGENVEAPPVVEDEVVLAGEALAETVDES